MVDLLFQILKLKSWIFKSAYNPFYFKLIFYDCFSLCKKSPVCRYCNFIRSWSNIGALKDQRIFISGQVWKIVIFARSNNAIFKFFLAPYKKSFKNLFWTWPSWLHRDFCTGFEFFWNYFRYYFFKYLPALIDPENLRQIIWL